MISPCCISFFSTDHLAVMRRTNGVRSADTMDVRPVPAFCFRGLARNWPILRVSNRRRAQRPEALQDEEERHPDYCKYWKYLATFAGPGRLRTLALDPEARWMTAPGDGGTKTTTAPIPAASVVPVMTIMPRQEPAILID